MVIQSKIEKHSSGVYNPNLIFGRLLTSGNYKKVKRELLVVRMVMEQRSLIYFLIHLMLKLVIDLQSKSIYNTFTTI